MRLLTIALALCAGSLMACSGSAVGTGTSGGASGAPTTIDQSGTGGTSGTATPPASATTAYDALFGRPATTALTPSSLPGLWAGTMFNTNDDVRLKIDSTSITIAVRCSSGLVAPRVVGMEVGAVVGATSIRLLESKSVGDYSCGLSVRPQTVPKCSITGTAVSGCFDVTGPALNFDVPLFTKVSSSYGANPDFTKVSD
jgi:hypothetical protein